MTKRTKQTCTIYIASVRRLRELFTVEDACLCEAFVNQNAHCCLGKMIVKHNEAKRIAVGHIVDETNVSTHLRTRSSAQIKTIKPNCYSCVDRQCHSKKANECNVILR